MFVGVKGAAHQVLALHSGPSEHTFNTRVFIEPMTGSSVRTLEVEHDVLVRDLRKFLQLWSVIQCLSFSGDLVCLSNLGTVTNICQPSVDCPQGFGVSRCWWFASKDLLS